MSGPVLSIRPWLKGRKAAQAGEVMTFDLEGTPYRGLNGGPIFKFGEALSFVSQNAKPFGSPLSLAGEGGPSEGRGGAEGDG